MSLEGGLAEQRARERRWARETRLCLGNRGEFRRERSGTRTLFRRADFPAELLLAAVAQHAAARGAGGPEVLKSDHRARVSRVLLEDPRAPGPLCVKEFVRPRLGQRLADRMRGSRARVAWVGAQACRVRGISTPQPLGAVEAGPRSYFVNAYVAGAVTLNDYVSDFPRPRDAAGRRRWRSFLAEAAAFVRHLHAHRLRHRDLAAKNILTRERDGGWEFYLIDLSDVRLGRPPSLRHRIRNLGQLAEFKVPPSRTDRLRFYRHYAEGLAELARRELPARIDAIGRARRERWLAHGGRRVLEERRRRGAPV